MRRSRGRTGSRSNTACAGTTGSIAGSSISERRAEASTGSSSGSSARASTSRSASGRADIARLVADAGLRLDESRDLDETIEAAASLPIPELADWCVIDLVEPDGTSGASPRVASDPARQAILDAIRDFPTAPDSSRARRLGPSASGGPSSSRT